MMMVEVKGKKIQVCAVVEDPSCLANVSQYKS